MITLFFYPHHAGIRSEMLYLNGGSKSARNECLRSSTEKRLKHLLAAKLNIYAQAKIVKLLHVMF